MHLGIKVKTTQNNNFKIIQYNKGFVQSDC